jgi:hypothetical protein
VCGLTANLLKDGFVCPRSEGGVASNVNRQIKHAWSDVEIGKCMEADQKSEMSSTSVLLVQFRPVRALAPIINLLEG